jgi:beta-ureidopropionase / N-carbamoyl-L-amino-acid hydrolase
MIPISCKDGISHNEIEDARAEHLGLGADVLFRAMLKAAGAGVS